jgi:hypothetical protein
MPLDFVASNQAQMTFITLLSELHKIAIEEKMEDFHATAQ